MRPTLTLICALFCVSAAFAEEPLTLDGVALKDAYFQTQGRQIWMSGQRFDIRIPEVRVVPTNGSISAAVDLEKLTIYINRIQVRKTFITNCYHTYIFVGYKRPVTFSAFLPVGVEGGIVQVGKPQVEFEIPDSNFTTQGPSYCRGGFFGNLIMKAVIRNAIANSKNQVQETLKKAVLGAFPE